MKIMQVQNVYFDNGDVMSIDGRREEETANAVSGYLCGKQKKQRGWRLLGLWR